VLSSYATKSYPVPVLTDPSLGSNSSSLGVQNLPRSAILKLEEKLEELVEKLDSIK